MTRRATLHALPGDATATAERQLRCAWSEIDALEAKLAAARAAARPLEHQVSDAHGYRARLTRPQLERLLGR